jgi:thiol-disulfide isomerase/thioredoxin
MQTRLVSYALIAASAASAAIVQDVREAVEQNNFALGESRINTYRAQHGVTPEMITALSWLGRGALAVKDYSHAEKYAVETYQLATAELRHRTLDRDAFLPVALGAAIEVQAQVLAARGDRTGAVAYLKQELRTYGSTSIRDRIQKNINLLTLEGKPAPAIDTALSLGPKAPPLSALKGKPVLLFFWAHWCGDCKTEVPALARLQRDFPGRFSLIAPTQRYGYAAQGEPATPEAELSYIDQVRQKYYLRLGETPVPVSEKAFLVYGCSSTPTIVLLDRHGIVRLYHPGAMTYEELRAEMEKLLAT